MMLHPTLVEVLDSQLSSDLNIEFFQSQDKISILTPAQLKKKALNLLGAFQALGMQRGHELVIHTSSNEDFVVAFWAAILGGIVPVPVAVGISDEHRKKLLRIISQLKHPRVFTTDELKERMLTFASSSDWASDPLADSNRWITRIEDAGQLGKLVASTPDDLAFIQYSSGSTGDPKGVCLTHKNVTTNLRAIVEAAGWTEHDRALSWMPLTHDMGLIGFHLSVLAAGMTHVIMDTSAFVRRPKLWLSLAADRKSTVLCSPNFGYQHYLKAVERKGLDDLDLQHVRQILNGAEPISRRLCDTFNATLAPAGLSATAMRPVYGLAEATVGVSFSTPGTAYKSTTVRRDRLAIGSRLTTSDTNDPSNDNPNHDNSLDLMHVGFAIRDVQLRVVDDQDNAVDSDTVGHLQLKGDSVTSGIYGNPAVTDALFTDDGWLRTGDSAALISGEGADELVIVGRIKDVLISSGQNYYAHDIENAVSTTEGAELGKVAVSSVITPASATEQVAVFVLFRKDLHDFTPLAQSLRAAISSQTGLEADFIVPVSRIPKTTSGKIQRHKLATAFMDGEFDPTLDTLGVRPATAHPADGDEPTAEVTVDEAMPRNVVDQLVAIAAGLVTEGSVGPDDNLFEVGVSSLTLTEIALAIEEQFPGKLDVSDLFDYPTLRDIATWVQRD